LNYAPDRSQRSVQFFGQSITLTYTDLTAGQTRTRPSASAAVRHRSWEALEHAGRRAWCSPGQDHPWTKDSARVTADALDAVGRTPSIRLAAHSARQRQTTTASFTGFLKSGRPIFSGHRSQKEGSCSTRVLGRRLRASRGRSREASCRLTVLTARDCRRHSSAVLCTLQRHCGTAMREQCALVTEL
jgi:hypothetical protein